MDTQSKSITTRWAAGWSSPDPSPWLSLYTPTATYVDHAFQLRRTGTAILRRHFTIWRTSIPDFNMEIERVDCDEALPGGRRRFSIRTINRGTFLVDLPSRKASGKKFTFSGVVDFIIDEESGLIELLNEWYTSEFGSGKEIPEYHTLEEVGA